MTENNIVKHRPDYLLLFLVLPLIVLGLLVLSAISPLAYINPQTSSLNTNTFYLQTIWVCIGMIGFWITSKIKYTFWQKLAPFILIIAIISNLIIAIIPGLGHSSRGATRWIDFGPLSFQPIELLKFAIVIFLAWWFTRVRKNINNVLDSIIPVIVTIIVSGLIAVVLQKDLGSGIIVLSIILAMTWVGGMHYMIFVGLGALISIAGVLAIYSQPYRLRRFLTFLDPEKDPTGSGYHILQALIAIGSGGVTGRGLGKSFQAYGYLPEANSDSIFAAISEQFGFIGSMIVIFLYFSFILRGLRIVKNAPDYFSRLLSIGIIAWIGSQAILNICAMLNLVPLTGIPLPFISQGGSSMLMILIGLGVLFNISSYTVNGDVKTQGLRKVI